MEQLDALKFSTLMVGIGELYSKTISVDLTNIYWLAMKKYELQDVQKAFNTHVNNPDGGQFFPKPADIVRIIEGSGETKALQAWAKVERAIIQIGRYQSVVFDDPLIHAVIDEMGGWIKLCAIKNDGLPFYANEFQKRYMGFVLKKPNIYPRYLCGIFEQENAKNGFECAAPVLIGDANKAVEVIHSGGERILEIQTLSQSIHEIMRQLPSSRTKGNKEDE
jgi:hypothetical protein